MDFASPNSSRTVSTVMELSPRIPDIYQSPSQQFLYSQTWAIDSSEVGWKWNPQSNSPLEPLPRRRILASTGTPDSSGAADSSYNSASSGGTNAEIFQINGNSQLLSRSYQQKQLMCSSRSFWREKHFRKLDLELRLKEEARAEQTLKQRCDKLQEHLKSAGTSSLTNIHNNIHIINNNINIKIKEVNLPKANSNLLSEDGNDENIVPHVKNIPLSASIENIEDSLSQLKANDDSNHSLMEDFFNDSLSDDILLAATQEVESKLETKSKPEISMQTEPTKQTDIEMAASEPKTECETPTSSRKKRARPSFYMKFLEDDCPEDWFASLDEAVLKATQPARNARSPFHRYKSMPVDTRRRSPCGTLYLTSDDKKSTAHYEKDCTTRPSNCALKERESIGIKRHASAHMLSPPNNSGTKQKTPIVLVYNFTKIL